jgi:hypothetical protein
MEDLKIVKNQQNMDSFCFVRQLRLIWQIPGSDHLPTQYQALFLSSLWFLKIHLKPSSYTRNGHCVWQLPLCQRFQICPTFGLKLPSSNCILLALRLFWASAGALAHCFYCDCSAKLFGTAILEYLIDSQSKVVAAPAKCQSSNGLVESHWKTMIHMA